MRFRFSYPILFLFFTAKLFCQDIIVKKDSTKTQVKILKVRPAEIKYKLYNYLDGPLYIISKKDVAYIKYNNGTYDIFNNTNELEGNVKVDTIYVNEIPLKDSVRIGDFIKFNAQVATVVYNSFSNVPRKNYMGMTSSNEYKSTSTKENVTFNLGFNFLFGKSPYIKHVIGINYLKTKSEFYNDYGSIGYSYHAKYRSDVDFVNIITGLRFTLFKKLYLEPLVIINFVANAKTTRSGTESTINKSTYIWSSSSFENEPTHNAVESTVSLSPKISYELPIKKIKVEAYLSYNFAIQYRLPWYQFGLHIFPFKKLR